MGLGGYPSGAGGLRDEFISGVNTFILRINTTISIIVWVVMGGGGEGSGGGAKGLGGPKGPSYPPIWGS